MAKIRRVFLMADEEDKKQKETIFHYSREHRLDRASPEVRALNDGNFAKPSLGKLLFGTRANKFLLISIVVISIFGLAINYINRDSPVGNSIIFGGNRLEIAILRVEEALVLSIVKNVQGRGEVFIGEVEVAVSHAVSRSNEEEGDIQIFAHRINFRPLESETYYISLPFSGNDFFVVLRAGDEQRAIRLSAIEAN
jgi:hypothetical protein